MSGANLDSPGESREGIAGVGPAAGPAAAAPPRESRQGIDRSAAFRDHLANERTLLAWQRTALAMVGIGFVVDRFAFEGTSDKTLAGTLLGLALIVAGGVAAGVGVYRFTQVERQIDTDSYRPSLGIHVAFSGAIVAGAVAMVLYVLLAGPG